MKNLNAPDVDAPDPEFKNSPIFDYEESEYVDFEMQLEVYYFNGKRYQVGEFVCSGSELLHGEEGGVWVWKRSCY